MKGRDRKKLHAAFDFTATAALFLLSRITHALVLKPDNEHNDTIVYIRDRTVIQGNAIVIQGRHARFFAIDLELLTRHSMTAIGRPHDKASPIDRITRTGFQRNFYMNISS
ncbi:hypothetical protein [Luteimonas panaciterrae]|uniref:hypothetical protein n=1 Tax=Luteimonas panaciterrae TaxID=363885 RepID=UPI001CFB175A|nr:hypothetical protein [Luteimonas panaciterrae]